MNRVDEVTGEPVTVAENRGMSYRWPVCDVTSTLHGTGTAYVSLSIQHSGRMHRFMASAFLTTIWSDGWWSNAHTPTGPWWGMDEDVKRYATAKLLAFAERALHQFRVDALAGHEAILPLFQVTEVTQG